MSFQEANGTSQQQKRIVNKCLMTVCLVRQSNPQRKLKTIGKTNL